MATRNPVTYQEVFTFLSNATDRYAQGCPDTRKRAIRKFANKIDIEDGVLFYIHYQDKDKRSVPSKWQWIGDKEMQQQILQSVHDNAAGGCHFGRDKTIEIRLLADTSGTANMKSLISTSRPVISARR